MACRKRSRRRIRERRNIFSKKKGINRVKKGKEGIPLITLFF